MKVKVGLVTKNVPKEYAHGIPLMKDEYFDKPDKLRLSVRERFFFAEAAWRQLLAQSDPNVYNFLLGAAPLQVIDQVNREMEKRYVIRYSNGAHAIAPFSVVKHAPIQICVPDVEYKDFHL